MFTLHMDSVLWFAAAAAVLIAVHLGIAAYLYRTAMDADGLGGEPEQRASRNRKETGGGAGKTAGDGHVSCPTCGTPNDPGYQFCRRCVADMSGNGAPADGPNATERLGS